MIRRAGYALLLAALGSVGCLTNRPLNALDGPAPETPGKPEPTLPPAKAAELCLKTGESLQSSGHLAEAAAEYEKARTHDPKLTPVCSLKLAAFADEKGDHARALAEYQKGLTAKPNDADLLIDLGYSHYNYGEWAEAEEFARKALKAQPKNQRAWNNLGMALAQQSRYEDALEAFTKAVKPADAYCNLGYILRTQGKQAESRDAYARALELEPGHPLARTALDKLDPAVAAAAAR
jgi:Tfp pilus assembly protein PilF